MNKSVEVIFPVKTALFRRHWFKILISHFISFPFLYPSLSLGLPLSLSLAKY